MVHYQSARLDAVFGALADPTRRAVLAKLSHGERSVGELAGPFGMSLPGFIKHLGILEDAGLIMRRKTGRVVIVDEAPATCSAASEIAALLAEDSETFRCLKAPVRRVCAVPVPVPYSPPLERAALPSRDDITAAVYEVLKESLRAL